MCLFVFVFACVCLFVHSLRTYLRVHSMRECAWCVPSVLGCPRVCVCTVCACPVFVCAQCVHAQCLCVHSVCVHSVCVFVCVCVCTVCVCLRLRVFACAQCVNMCA